MHPKGVFTHLLSFALAAFAVVSSGCYSRPTNADLQPVSHGIAGIGRYKPDTIFVATNRERDEALTGPYFSKERGKQVRYARFGVSVPGEAEHGTNVFETPRGGRLVPEEQFFVVDNDLLEDEAMFRRQLELQVRRNNRSKKVWIYVHGVYTRFAEGVFFISQLNQDSGFEGTPLLFAWPTGGEWFDYVYDKDSAATSRDALERTIRIASESGAEEVFILAHSMGCHLTMETLRQVAIAGDATFGGKLHCVLLASPDISVDVFESQLRRLEARPKRPRIGILLSRDDKLLKVANIIARGDKRLGRLDNDRMNFLGVDVFDLTSYTPRGVSTHYKFAATPKSLVGIHGIIDQNQKENAKGEIYFIDENGEIVTPLETGEYLELFRILTDPIEMLGVGDLFNPNP